MAKRGSNAIPLSRIGVLVAQLESIVATARQQPPDPILCFDLLSELVTAIHEEPKEAIVQWQRKCEDALYSLLILGVRRPTRRLASSAMARVIAKGDSISVYSRVSSLQGWLVDGKRNEPLSCAGVAQCLGELYHFFGRKITSGLTETTMIAAKLMKFNEDFVRQDGLQMLHHAIEGSAGNGPPAAFSEAFRVIMRVGLIDKIFLVRLAAAKCLKVFANIGGPGFGTSELENAAAQCVKALEDPVPSVRDAIAEALGALVALGMNLEAETIQRGKSKTPAKKSETGRQKHLIFPFKRASGIHGKDLRVGLTMSWVFFLQMIHLKYCLLEGELQNLALQAIDMLDEDPVVDSHSVACVLYVIRVGVADQMTEPSQRSFLVFLARQLETSNFSPSKGVAILRILSYLLAVLGEVPTDLKEVLDNTVVAALSHPSPNVRVEAALTMRELAEVDPICVAGLISYGVTTLYALRETVFMGKGNQLKFELDSLHGQATVLAALVSISRRLPLGYPARLPKSVFDVSKKMLTELSRNPVVSSVEREAGWSLLASLIASMPKEELEDQVFDILLLWAGSLGKYPEHQIQQSTDLISDIRVLTAAVDALAAFIRSFVSPTVTASNGGVLLQPVLLYLSGALSYVSFLTAKQLENIKPTLDVFTIKTLNAYQSIFDPMVYKRDHAKIIEICTSPFRDPSGYEESSCLRLLLEKKDACLGPWMPGRDWFEDELRAFEGGKDGILPCVWENQVSIFPQPETVRKMLVNQMLLCFGSMFAIADSDGKVMLLNNIVQCLKSGKKQSWHASSVTNACVGILCGLKNSLSLHSQILKMEILNTIQNIFLDILVEGDICAAQIRAASEGLGLLARVGTDSFTAKMTRSLLAELASAVDPYHLGSLAFSLGCIHRCAGGMALSVLVPSTVSSMCLLAKSSNSVLQKWSLYALLLTIEAAGLSYVSQVQATLFLALEILLSEESGRADLRQGIARLINAIVAVLGPELSPGSTFFSRCKSVVAETSSGQETSTLLECVRFTQQLVLFAPQAVSVQSHVRTLLPTLSSRQPTLRHLAVSTLQHLIEKYPVAVVNERIEENLFSMLDEETDPEIGSLIRTTINRFLYVSSPSCPSRWLAVCHNMVRTSSSRMNTSGYIRSSRNGVPEGDNSLGEDDENMIAASTSKQIQSSVIATIPDLRRDKYLRYRTRVFAAECLSHLPVAVGNNPAHFDLSLARKHISQDCLVSHLQELVSLAYQISTGQFEGMQPLGVKLLFTIMEKFEKTPDPDLPGHFLVEQYQAQLVSAVRSSVALSSGPLLLEAGLQLAAKILISKIMNGDPVALQRLFSLISRLLDDFRDLYYPSFAEWVACEIKIRLLAAHASIKCHVYTIFRKKVPQEEYLALLPLFSRTSNMLGNYWTSVLKDYCFICFGLQSKPNYKPFLHGIQSPLVSSKVKTCLDEAWALILQATAFDAVPLNFDMKKYSSSENKDLCKASLISGHKMVTLAPKEFHFLWALGLLMVFQGQQPTRSSELSMLSSSMRFRTNDGVSLEGRRGKRSIEIALVVFQALTASAFFDHGYLTQDICGELLQVLLHADQMSDSWDCLAIPLLSQIVRFSPDDYFEKEDFVSMTTELCLNYLYRMFQRDPGYFSQNHICERDLLSDVTSVAEIIANKLAYMKLWNLWLAFLLASYECIRRATTDSSLSKMVAFLQSVSALLKKTFEGNSDLTNDDARMVLGGWVSTVVHLSQDLFKGIHMVNRKNSDSVKLLSKKLAFCLEEASHIARVTHDSQTHGHQNDRIFFHSLYLLCVKCIRMALSDYNKQVGTVAVHVLKNIAQIEGSEGPKDHSFLLFFTGELLSDIFILIQRTLKELPSKESVAILDECLWFLFLFHTLSQASKCLRDAMYVLLEAILLVFSVDEAVHSQELNQIKNVAMVLVSRLVQVPSHAVLMKDILFSMSVDQRKQLQDIIRASTAQSQNEIQRKLVNPSPVLKIPIKLEPASTEVTLPSAINNSENTVGNEVNGSFGDEEDNDDWDTFQSFPAETTVTDLRTDKHTDALNGETSLENDQSHKEWHGGPNPEHLDVCHMEETKPSEGVPRHIYPDEVDTSLDSQHSDKGVSESSDMNELNDVPSEIAKPDNDEKELVDDCSIVDNGVKFDDHIESENQDQSSIPGLEETDHLDDQHLGAGKQNEDVHQSFPDELAVTVDPKPNDERVAESSGGNGSAGFSKLADDTKELIVDHIMVDERNRISPGVENDSRDEISVVTQEGTKNMHPSELDFDGVRQGSSRNEVPSRFDLPTDLHSCDDGVIQIVSVNEVPSKFDQPTDGTEGLADGQVADDGCKPLEMKDGEDDIRESPDKPIKKDAKDLK